VDLSSTAKDDSEFLMRCGSAFRLGNSVDTYKNCEWMGVGCRLFLCSFPVGWHPWFFAEYVSERLFWPYCWKDGY